MGGKGGEDCQSQFFTYTAKLNSRSECPSDQPEATAQQSGSGFMETQAEPRLPKALKLAWPGLAYIRPSLAGLTASGWAGTTLVLFQTEAIRAAVKPLPDDPDNHREDEIQVIRVPCVPDVGNLSMRLDGERVMTTSFQSHDPLIRILDYNAKVRSPEHDCSLLM